MTTISDTLPANEMLAAAEHKAVVGYAIQDVDLGTTDRRGNKLTRQMIVVRATEHGEFAYRYWFLDECGPEGYDLDSREDALQIIIEVQMHRHLCGPLCADHGDVRDTSVMS